MEKLRGKGVVAGIAIARILRSGQNLDGHMRDYAPEAEPEEWAKVEAALADVAALLNRQAEDLKRRRMTPQAAILEAHSIMVRDPLLKTKIADMFANVPNAPQAVLGAATELAELFERMEDAYFRERAVDVRDVGGRIARHILGVADIADGDQTAIICGEDIEPSVIANIPPDKIAGVALGRGSTTCHAVIIAKARALPTVVGLGAAVDKLATGMAAIIDGTSGEVIIEPTPAVRREYEKRQQEEHQVKRRYDALKRLPAITLDGRRVELGANIGLNSDIDAAFAFGAEGVGLFRSEFIFMGRPSMPDEEEQFGIYKEAVQKCGGRRCIVRTMDVGGDKPLPYLNIEPEGNPFLGWRAIRISLIRRDLFIPQLKALYRAALYGKAGILLPMIISVDELKQALAIIDEAKRELKREKKMFAEEVEIGIMIETPAAAVIAPFLARYVDFFSIGTNDLVQYTLAVDRVNHNVGHLYDHFHPAALRLIKDTISAARQAGKWVGICGEMAADPLAAALLTALGADELSMSAPSIPAVKERIRAMDYNASQKLLAAIDGVESSGEIVDIVKNFFA